MARALLDAQVEWTVNRLTGDELPDSQLVRRRCARRRRDRHAGLTCRPGDDQVDRPHAVHYGSAERRGVDTGGAGAEILMSNPAGTYALGEVVDRDNVARITDEVLALTRSSRNCSMI